MGPIATALAGDKGIDGVLAKHPSDPGSNVIEIIAMWETTKRLLNTVVFTALAGETGGNTTLSGPAAQYSIKIGAATNNILSGNYAGWKESLTDAKAVLQAT